MRESKISIWTHTQTTGHRKKYNIRPCNTYRTRDLQPRARAHRVDFELASVDHVALAKRCRMLHPLPKIGGTLKSGWFPFCFFLEQPPERKSTNSGYPAIQARQLEGCYFPQIAPNAAEPNPRKLAEPKSSLKRRIATHGRVTCKGRESKDGQWFVH